MEFLFVLLLALALSFDSFAVSVSCGLYLPQITFRNALKIGLSLSFFQALLPLIGWLFGHSLKPVMDSFDHWVAFGLLALLGLKMIIGSFSKHNQKAFNPLNPWVVIWLSLATSIDALVVGFSFALIEVHLAITVVTIAGVTLVAAMTGILIGKKTSGMFGKRMELLGGLILIAIGLKILFAHLIESGIC